MKKAYQISDAKKRRATRELQSALGEHDQILLPMVELIESGQLFVQEFMLNVSCAALQAVLELSARELAGPAHQGVRRGEIVRHGHQNGTISLATHKLRVQKPRLRQKGG